MPKNDSELKPFLDRGEIRAKKWRLLSTAIMGREGSKRGA